MHIKELIANIDYEKLLEFIKLYLSSHNDFSNINKSFQVATQCRIGLKPEDELYDSCGSLIYDWDNYDAKVHSKIPRKEKILTKELFTSTPVVFQKTVLQEVNDYFVKEYDVVRGRIMVLGAKSTLTYHTDDSPRIHIPLITSRDSLFIIEDIIYRLEYRKTYFVNTLKKHTAVNTNFLSRVHLVYCLR